MTLLRTLALITFFLLFNLPLIAQEICNNGYDDDGDGLIDLNDRADCSCLLDAQPPSLLPNPSFERYSFSNSGCTVSDIFAFSEVNGQLSCADGWLQPTGSSADAFHLLAGLGSIDIDFPLPLPAGLGFAGIFYDHYGEVRTSNMPELIATCLTEGETLEVGERYRYSGSLGFGKAVSGTTDPSFPNDYSYPTPSFVLYGIRNCSEINNFGLDLSYCERLENLTWEVITTFEVAGRENAWNNFAAEFTPTFPYEALVLGRPCDWRLDDQADATIGRCYYYVDNIRLTGLNQADGPVYGPVSVSGGDCTAPLRFTSVDAPDAAYQWYRNGVAVGGATSRSFEPTLAGEYVLRTTDPSGCALSEPLSVPLLPPLRNADILPDTVFTCMAIGDTVRVLFPSLHPAYQLTSPPMSAGPRPGLYVSQPGDYPVRVASPCGTTTELVSVIYKDETELTINSSREPSCDDAFIDYEVTTNFPYVGYRLIDQAGNTLATAEPGETALRLSPPFPQTAFLVALVPTNTCFADTILVFGREVGFAENPSIAAVTCDNPNGRIVLNVDEPDRYDYTWIDSAGNDLGVNDTSIEVPLGTYTVIISDRREEYCDLIRSFTIEFLPGDFVTLIPDACGPTSSAMAVPDQGVPPYIIDWFDEQGTILATDQMWIDSLPAGNYHAEFKDALGCTTEQLFTVAEGPGRFRIDTVIKDTDCVTRSGTLQVELMNGSPPVRLTLDNGRAAEGNRFTGLPTGTYVVRAEDIDGCVVSTNPIPVRSPVDPEFRFDFPTVLSLGNSTTLRWWAAVTPGGWRTSWEPDPALNCWDCPFPTLQPTTTNTYAVTLIDTFGCEYRDSISVIVDNSATAYFPSAFSPNGDGINDTYRFFPSRSISSVLFFRIYDRWGNLVYTHTEGTVNWDGRVAGIDAAEQTFVYVGELLLIDGRREGVRGGFVLVR